MSSSRSYYSPIEEEEEEEKEEKEYLGPVRWEADQNEDDINLYLDNYLKTLPKPDIFKYVINFFEKQVLPNILYKLPDLYNLFLKVRSNDETFSTTYKNYSINIEMLDRYELEPSANVIVIDLYYDSDVDSVFGMTIIIDVREAFNILDIRYSFNGQSTSDSMFSLNVE